MSSAWPSAPHAITSATDASIALRSDSVLGFQCRPGLLLGVGAPGEDRVDAGLDGQPLRAFGVGLRALGQLRQDGGGLARACPASRSGSPPARWPSRWPTVSSRATSSRSSSSASSPCPASNRLTACKLDRLAPNRARSAAAANRSARSRSSSRHGVPGRVEVQRRIGRQVGFQRQQRATHRRLRIAIRGVVPPAAGQFTAHLRQVHLTGGRAAQLAEQRVREPRHQRAAGALDGDQVHLRRRPRACSRPTTSVSTSTSSGSHCDSVSTTRRARAAAGPAGCRPGRSCSATPRRRRPRSRPRPPGGSGRRPPGP